VTSFTNEPKWRFVQEDVVRVDEMIRYDGSLLSAKQPVRRTVSDDNRLQHQQHQQQHQLPSLSTRHLSPAKADFTLLSPVSTLRNLCLKSDTDVVAHCNFNAHQPILVMLADVAERVCHRVVIC